MLIDANELIALANSHKDKTIDANDIARFPSAKIGDMVDSLFSHNEIISLWYDKPEDRHYSYRLWRGEAWKLPKKYKDLRLIKVFGTIPEKISEADTINILVTPYICPAYEAKVEQKEDESK